MSFKPFTLSACELGKADYLNLLVLMVLYDDRFAFLYNRYEGKVLPPA